MARLGYASLVDALRAETRLNTELPMYEYGIKLSDKT